MATETTAWIEKGPSNGVYIGATVLVAVLVAVQIAVLQGSLLAVLAVSFVNAFVLGLINMGLLYQKRKVVGLIFVPTMILLGAFITGMLLSGMFS